MRSSGFGRGIRRRRTKKREQIDSKFQRFQIPELKELRILSTWPWLFLTSPTPPPQPSPARGEGANCALPPCGGGLGWGVGLRKNYDRALNRRRGRSLPRIRAGLIVTTLKRGGS